MLSPGLCFPHSFPSLKHPNLPNLHSTHLVRDFSLSPAAEPSTPIGSLSTVQTSLYSSWIHSKAFYTWSTICALTSEHKPGRSRTLPDAPRRNDGRWATGKLSLTPDEHTDFIISMSCLKALFNKLSLPGPGSFLHPSTASLLLPAIVSWIWICLCRFLGAVLPQISCCCLFLSTWPYGAFCKISPTYLQACLVLLRGEWYKIFLSHQPSWVSWSHLALSFSKFCCHLSFFMQDISMSARMKKYWECMRPGRRPGIVWLQMWYDFDTSIFSGN